MNEFEYIAFRIQDLNPQGLLYRFPNGYRYDSKETTTSAKDPSKKRLGFITADSTIRNCANINYSSTKILDHAWEPLELEYDKEFWDLLEYECTRERFGCDQIIILHSEQSQHVVKLQSDQIKPVHWFANGYLCAEHWYRLYKDIRIVTDYRPILTRWICANRLIDNKRSYRLQFLNMLDTSTGTYSLPYKDPQTNRSPNEIFPDNTILPSQFDNGANSSAWITVNQDTPINSAFLHVVTETVIDRIHLTEKIFKPVVLKQPFVLVGGAGCLEYLHSYGFKTFNDWWSEDYDTITDDKERMQAVADIVNWIGAMDISELEKIRASMQNILNYNYSHFYKHFGKQCWSELITNLRALDNNSL